MLTVLADVHVPAHTTYPDTRHARKTTLSHPALK